MQSIHYVDSWLRETSVLSHEEKTLLMYLLGDPQNLQHSVVSPRFRNAERKSLAGPFPDSWPILKDAYLAYAGVLKLLHSGGARSEDDDSHIRHATSAMTTLRSLPITNPEDAKLCLTLGSTLALSVSAAIGMGITDICHYCLSVTKPFIDTTAIDTEKVPQIGLLVLLETMECLVYRQKPTLRIPLRTPSSVDRHLGLSLSLLPYYHDLCIISNSLLDRSDARLLGPHQQQLEELRARVEDWQPSHPERFINEFSAAEVVQLLAQARAYRLAALLLVHRLRYPFGQENGQADIWSHEIMLELELAKRISKQPVRFVTLPFIVAAIEVRDPTERENTKRNVDGYVDQFTPVVQEATKIFLSRIWNERDLHVNCSWLDSVYKPCPVLSAIGGHLLD